MLIYKSDLTLCCFVVCFHTDKGRVNERRMLVEPLNYRPIKQIGLNSTTAGSTTQQVFVLVKVEKKTEVQLLAGNFIPFSQ